MALNSEKLIAELDLWFATFRNPPPAKHKGGVFVNRLVEACRASPYASGHMAALGLVVTVAAVLLWWLR